MKYKIVSDSSSNILTLGSVPFSSVPLHIVVDGEDFVDNKNVNLQRLEDALTACKSSGTACPGIDDWISAFEDAEAIFCVTITSALSGSCASAQAAKTEYEKQYPHRRVYIIDSLSTGPEMSLIIEKLEEMILSEMDASSIFRKIQSYTQHTHLLFSLESLANLSKNGRVSHASAKLAGILGIRVIGQASPHGELELLSKCRGEQRALSYLIKCIKEHGYVNGKIRIAHNRNEKAARKLMLQLQSVFKAADIKIEATRALCSYYAEKGGLLIGFEC